MFSQTDFVHMERALALARRGMYTTDPNPRVGCVIVKNGEVIGEGFTQPAGQDHAEIRAMKDARSRGHDLRGATAYVTLEPCSHFGRTPPCANALIEAQVARVVAAMEDPNPQVSGRGLAILRDAGIEVRCGLLANEAHELNIGFVSRMTRGRPWVRMKVAASLDGRTGLPSGVSQWITGEAARSDGHAWRKRAGALLTGVGTVLDDNPRLDVRLVPTPKQPMRVIVDSRLETPAASRILAPPGQVLVYCAQPEPQRQAALETAGAEIATIANAHGKVDLAAMLADLAQRGVNELHVEAGHKLNGSFVREGLVDEFLIYVAPKLIGIGRELAAFGPLASLDDSVELRYLGITPVGQDLRIIARPLA